MKTIDIDDKPRQKSNGQIDVRFDFNKVIILHQVAADKYAYPGD